MNATPQFERFIAPARAYPQIWRLVLGVVVITFIYVCWITLMAVGAVLATGGLAEIETELARVGFGSEPGSLVLLLATFGGMMLGAFAAVRLLHKRPVGTLFGPPAKVLRDFAAGAAILGAVTVVGAGLTFAMVDMRSGVDIRVWLMFLPLALIGLLIQTGAEEVVFRGYLQQQLAARFVSAWVWMGVPSVLFGLVHYAPTEMGSNTWMMVLLTGAFGLVAADLTARSGSLGLAWGLHFANNVTAILFFTAGGMLDGLALFRFPFSAQDSGAMAPMILADLLGLGLVWGLCRLWLRSR